MSLQLESSRIVHELPSAPDAIRNSEGSFLTLEDGRILFVYSRFRVGDGFDHDPAGLAGLIFSPHGSEMVEDLGWLLTPEADGAVNQMSVSLLRMQDGAIGVFYFLRRGFEDGRLHLRRSYDGGRSWTPARPCILAPGYHVSNNDRVVRLRSGRLLLPAAYHRPLELPQPDGSIRYGFEYVAHALFFYSDDDGETWKQSNGVYVASRHTRTGFQEPGVVELENGCLFGWGRTDLGRQYETQSTDGGRTWTPGEPSAFTSPESPLSMKRDPSDRSLVAVWNPAPGYPTRPTAGTDRTPLVLARSVDDGASWSQPVMIEDDPAAGYCYTAMHALPGRPGAWLLAYCAGSVDEGILTRLRIRRIELKAD